MKSIQSNGGYELSPNDLSGGDHFDYRRFNDHRNDNSDHTNGHYNDHSREQYWASLPGMTGQINKMLL
jgi:hypothetical protein